MLSDCICSGLQLANLWQDVAVDLEKGRVYLPQLDLQRFGVEEADIVAARSDARWRSLLAFEVARARAMLQAGAPLARRLPGRAGWELRAIVQGGLRILDRIEGVGYDVFSRRPTLNFADKFIIAWRTLTYPNS